MNSGINLAQVLRTLKSTSKIVIDYVMRLACFIRIAGFQSDSPSNSHHILRSLTGVLQPHFPCGLLSCLNIIVSHWGNSTCVTPTSRRISTIESLHAAHSILVPTVHFGWCAITALEKFNFKWGGHLILWDLHHDLHVDFLPGSTILIPSASLFHGNTTIQPGKN